MPPTCPTDYSCTFTLLHARTVTRAVGPWWQHTAGWIVALAAILTIGVVLAYATAQVTELHRTRERERRIERERETERAHALALEEQRTLQADAAKGNPEMLKLIRESRL